VCLFFNNDFDKEFSNLIDVLGTSICYIVLWVDVGLEGVKVEDLFFTVDASSCFGVFSQSYSRRSWTGTLGWGYTSLIPHEKGLA
jgi:hypothetical protein